MKRKELLIDFIEANKKHFVKSGSLYGDFLILIKIMHKETLKVNKLSEIFKELGIGDVFITCPCCSSPALLEYQDCNFCGETLMKEEKIEKVSKNKTSKTVSKKPNKKVESEDADFDKDFDEFDEKPKNVSKKPQAKPAKKVESIKEVDTDEEEDFPTEKEVNKMDIKELKSCIKKHKLDIDTKACGRSISKWKDAVNNVIDGLCCADEVESKDEYDGESDDTVGKTSNDDDDFDLDIIDFEDIDGVEIDLED